MKRQERIDLAQWATEFTLKNGADQAAVSLWNSRDVEIGYRDSKIENLKESTQNSINIEIYADNRYSQHSTNDLRKDELKKFISEAVSSTKYLTSDEFRALPDPKYYPQKIRLDLKLYDKKYKSIDSVSRVEYASEIEALTKAKGDMIVSVTSGYSDSNSQSVKVHSNGFLGEKESSSFSIGAEITVNDPDGGLPEDWYWVTTRFYDDLPSPDAISDEVFRRVQQKLGQKKIDSGAYDLILENRVGGRVIRQLMQPMNGSSLQQKNSWMDGLLGERVASEKLTIIDDPFIEKAMGSRFYDGDGLASQKRVMIEKGILKHFYIDNYYGRKLNMEPTSGGASNLVFEYGEKSLEGLISGVDKGILVNGIIGGNSNSTTGDFSFGVMGLLIENGRITQPVNEMNVSGSAKEFWRNLVEMGNDPNPYSSRKIPSMYFKDVFFSGI